MASICRRAGRRPAGNSHEPFGGRRCLEDGGRKGRLFWPAIGREQVGGEVFSPDEAKRLVRTP